MERTNHKQQFSIASLLLLTTVVAISLGLFRLSPPLGVISAILGIPALVRTALLAMRETQHGGWLTAREKMVVFLHSIAIAVATVWVTGFVFFLACFVAFAVAGVLQPLGDAIVIGVAVTGSILAMCIAVVTAWRVITMCWPSHDLFLDALRPRNRIDQHRFENPTP
jgi:hypothetical protein